MSKSVRNEIQALIAKSRPACSFECTSRTVTLRPACSFVCISRTVALRLTYTSVCISRTVASRLTYNSVCTSRTVILTNTTTQTIQYSSIAMSRHSRNVMPTSLNKNALKCVADENYYLRPTKLAFQYLDFDDKDLEWDTILRHSPLQCLQEVAFL